MSDKHFVGLNLLDIEDKKQTLPISRVTFLVDDENSITAGDDTGFELVSNNPHATQAMANSVLARLKGYEYHAYSAESTSLDPAAELGDGITAGSVYSFIGRLSDKGDGYPSAEAPGEPEYEDEYAGFEGYTMRSFNRKIAETRSIIAKTAEEIRLEISNDMEGLSSSFSLKIDSINTRINGIDGQYSSLSQTVDGFRTEISGLNGQISTLTQTATSLESQIKSATGDISTLKQTATSLESNITSLNGSISSINQTISNITISVGGSLGGTASISLSAGGHTTSGSVDLSNVRSAFANDTSTVTISGGTITFNSGTFILNSGNISIDKDGNLTSENGTINGAAISGGSVTTQFESIKSVLQNGVLRCYRNSAFIGKIGAASWEYAGNIGGLDIGIGSGNYFISFSRHASGYDYEDIGFPVLVYADRDIYYNDQSISGASQSYYLPSHSINLLDCDVCLHSRNIKFFLNENGTENKIGTIEVSSIGGILIHNNDDSNGINLGATGSYTGVGIAGKYVVGISSTYQVNISSGDTINISGNTVNVDGTVKFNGTVVSNSDVRFKSSIEESTVDALSVLNNINLYSFDWSLTGEHRNLGFISQQIDVESTSDLVYYSENDDTYQIKDLAFIPYIVRSIQQLYSMISPAAAAQRIRTSNKKWTPDMYSAKETEEFLNKVIEYRRRNINDTQ